MRKEDLSERCTRNEDGTWTCNACKSSIRAKTVAHPIHDGPFPLSGSGKCEYEEVIYCPKCEKEPSFHGTPIKKPFGHDFW